jgi:hypothetical protein
MRTQTLTLNVEENTTIRVTIRDTTMDTDVFIADAIDILENYMYDSEHYHSVKAETTQY